MIITLRNGVDPQLIEQLKTSFIQQGFEIGEIKGTTRNILGILGDTATLDEVKIKAHPAVASVTRIVAQYKKASRVFHPDDTIVDVNGVKIGGNEKIVVIGGPCSVESVEHTCLMAQAIKDAGGRMLRGGAYKPRTSPYAFQGMGTEGIKAMAEARRLTGLPVVSELMDTEQLDEFEEYVDVVQIGARNMQNFSLLKAVGKNITKPVLLKRGMSNTIEEWIMSAEYIMANGNENIIMCERGIRTFEKYTRSTLDLAVIPILKEKTHLPVVIDPSHAAGNWKYVEAMSLAAVAAGADGLIIEVHDRPDCALRDGPQSLKPDRFAGLVKKARAIAQVTGRDI
ncbi:MAG: 3-deoxy-7-phosphoheptulonate synthase [Oscillospiraceae bacterium]|nr:3-deoxy-7-phosphoheptulonate synthase [Oscillospiraceae bacterium]